MHAGRETVLLAEADDELREQAADALRGDGYDVIEVEDGLELRDYLDGVVSGFTAPDVIVSESALPGDNPVQLLASLREKYSVTPFILIGECAIEWVADVVLPGPLDIERLRAAVMLTA